MSNRTLQKIIAGILTVFIVMLSVGIIPTPGTKKALAFCGTAAATAASSESAADSAGAAVATVAGAAGGAAPSGAPVTDKVNTIISAKNTGESTAQTIDQKGHKWVTAIGAETYCWKEFVFDTLFYLLNNVIIEQMTASIVNWINGGFKGSPQFTLDLKKTLNDVELKAFGGLVNELSQSTGKDFGLLLCTNFSSQLVRGLQAQLAVAKGGSTRSASAALWRQYQKCDIEDTLKNLGSSVESFRQDFRKGGWPAWLRIIQPSNNQYGAYIGVQTELARRLQEAHFIQNTELGWGSGFLSWKKSCGAYDTSDGKPLTGVDTSGYDDEPSEFSNGGSAPLPNSDLSGNSGPTTHTFTGACIDPNAGKIMTPGKVVEDQLNQSLGSPRHRVEAADEIDEVIGALFGQLMNQVFGPGGLLGASHSSGGQQSYTTQLANSTENSDKFKQIAGPQITSTLAAVSEQSKIYESLVEEINTALELLHTLHDCYASHGMPTDSVNAQITALEQKKANYEQKSTSGDAWINQLTSLKSDKDLQSSAGAFSSFDPTGYISPDYNLKQELSDIKTTESQAQSDLSACEAATNPSLFLQQP